MPMIYKCALEYKYATFFFTVHLLMELRCATIITLTIAQHKHDQDQKE